MAGRVSNWRYLGRWVQPPLFSSFWLNWSERSPYSKLQLPEISGALVYLDGHHFMLESEITDLEEEIERRLATEDRVFFTSMFEALTKQTNAYLKHASILDAEDGIDLHERFSRFVLETDLLFTHWMAAFLIGPVVTLALDGELRKNRLSQIDLLAHFDLPRPTFLIQQERETRSFHEHFEYEGIFHLLGGKPNRILPLLSNTHPVLAKSIQFHLKEFEWVGTHHCWGDPLTPERLFLQIREALPAPKKGEKRKDLPEKLDYLIKLTNEYAYWRQYCAECSVIGLYRARKMLALAAKQFGITYEDVIWMTKAEILAGLIGGKIPGKNELSKRQNIYGHLPNDDGETLITGDSVRGLRDILVPKFDKTTKVFSGTVGSIGKASGHAFVAFTPQEAFSMKKGEILVVPQTTPDYVMVMKKAAAIVTDEGGITCHAAIVSRELGIPCIVGTRIGTHVIKTGDKLEVDASTGTVKKL